MRLFVLRYSLPLLTLLTATSAGFSAELPSITVTDRNALGHDPNTRSFEHEDLARFGDGGDLTDALRRLPGVQITPEGRIQLRGMGNGYTRVEINGQTVGGLNEGVMLQDLTVDMVEQVDIVRGWIDFALERRLDRPARRGARKENG